MTTSTFTRETIDGHAINANEVYLYAGRDRRKADNEPTAARILVSADGKTVTVKQAKTKRVIDTFSTKAKFWASVREATPAPKAKAAKKSAKKSAPDAPEVGTPERDAWKANKKLNDFAKFAAEHGWSVTSAETNGETTTLTINLEDQSATLTFEGARYIAARSYYTGHDRKFQFRNVSAARKAIEKGISWARKCDARCTMAKSDDCSCECGGENHGKGRIAL